MGTVVGTVVGTVRALYGHCAGTVAWEIIGNTGNRKGSLFSLSRCVLLPICTACGYAHARGYSMHACVCDL